MVPAEHGRASNSSSVGPRDIARGICWYHAGGVDGSGQYEASRHRSLRGSPPVCAPHSVPSSAMCFRAT